MIERITLAGFGGQGVLFLGKMITYAGMLDGREVCWIPSYGPEMRGGTANCTVIVSDEEIYSPVVEYADFAIVLNQPSYDKFLSKVKPGGVLVVNSSIILNTEETRDDIEIISLPASDIARELGNPSLANMVCLGALLPKLKLANLGGVVKAMDAVVGKKRPEMYDLNLAAVKKGLEG